MKTRSFLVLKVTVLIIRSWTPTRCRGALVGIGQVFTSLIRIVRGSGHVIAEPC